MKDLRTRSDLTTKQLAEMAEVHVSFVRSIERGAQAPSVETARRLLNPMTEQSRIRWLNSRINDVKILDRKLDFFVAFKFKAEVRGQNKRSNEDGIIKNQPFHICVNGELIEVVTFRRLGPLIEAQIAAR